MNWDSHAPPARVAIRVPAVTRMSRVLIKNPSDLIPQLRNLRYHDIPERVVIEPEVRGGLDIAKTGHSLPVHFRMTLTHVCRNRL